MTESLWGRRPPPAAQGRVTPLGRWEPRSPADLTAHRLQVVAALHAAKRPGGAGTEAIERLELAFEELVSNALRHGGAPVRVVLTDCGTHWLLEVSDAAADRPPVPAVDRDAAEGGLGLYLVGRICEAHGWTSDGVRKTAWACVAFSPGSAPSPRSRPRSGRSGAERTKR